MPSAWDSGGVRAAGQGADPREPLRSARPAHPEDGLCHVQRPPRAGQQPPPSSPDTGEAAIWGHGREDTRLGLT